MIRRSWQNYRALVRAAEAAPPDVFVPIDFLDFNFFLARALHKRGVPVVYYISPQLWAWRRGRMKTMKRVADRVLVIFPFEVPFYEAAGVPVTFVGHPLLELTPPPTPRDVVPPPARARSGAAGRRPAAGQPRNELRAILPGSRRAPPASSPAAAAGAVRRRARAASRRRTVRAAVGLARRRVAAGGRRRADRRRPRQRRRRVLASGTVTVQAALHGCPMVVVYRVGAADLQARQAAASASTPMRW